MLSVPPTHTQNMSPKRAFMGNLAEIMRQLDNFDNWNTQPTEARYSGCTIHRWIPMAKAQDFTNSSLVAGSGPKSPHPFYKVASRPLYAVESQSHVTFWKRIVSPYNPLPRQHLARSFAQRHTGVSRFRAMTATGHLCLWPVNGPIVPCAVEHLHATNH